MSDPRIQTDPAANAAAVAATEPTDASSTETAAAPGGATAAELALKIEAVLLTTDRPIAPVKLAEVVGASVKVVNGAVASLNETYQAGGRSFRVEQVAGGWQIMTLPQYADVLAALHRTKAQTRLTPAALETLAIIAYRQPILRADIEAIRGVACGEVLRSLMDRRLIKIVGRAEVVGRPMLYGTTKIFLELFGLANLKDLPKAEELRPKA